MLNLRWLFGSKGRGNKKYGEAWALSMPLMRWSRSDAWTIGNAYEGTLVLGARERGQGQGGGREDEGYWRRALRQLLRNAIDLLVFATGRVSIPDLYRVVVSAAKSMVEVKSDDWKSRSFCYQCLVQADKVSKSAS